MKRLALLLGSLLVVSAAASAKEVVPAPVVVEEAPVQIVEKEVIVYRDKEEGFRPNGYVDLQYRWYGDTEGNGTDYKAYNTQADPTLASNNGGWNKKNNYSRMQLQGMINMTENQSLEYRVRNFDNLDGKSSEQSTTETQTRLRYFYDHGVLGDSKVDLTSRVHYEKAEGAQTVEYQARFNFADYLLNNDFVKTTDFTVAPKYGYSWNEDNSDDYENMLGADLYTMHQLPWGFSFEFNLYFTQHFYGQDQFFDAGNKMEDKNFTVDMEAYIYNTTNLYTNGKVSVDFNFEGGYDAYSWSQEKKFGAPRGDENSKYFNEYVDRVGVANIDETSGVGTDDTKYSLYALPSVQLNYQATDFLTLYAAVGAEYRDWTVDNGSSASNWRWQPTAWAGFKTTF